jgi:ubiquitin carboxyl-terminal hydrolase 20/33
VQKFSKWFAEKSPEASKRADYALQSVVDHHGSANGGHYVAQVKSPITGKWNVYDDENVTTIKDGSQVYLGQPSYILFYRKV